MKAIVRDRYGSMDDLELRDVDVPEPAADEVLVRVRAAGVDRGVWHVMTGLPYPIRLAGYGFRTPKNPVLGTDVSGEVEAVGTNVTAFASGDKVFGLAKGAFAEYTCAPAYKLVHKPVDLGFEQAAVVGISGSTALQGLRDHAMVGKGTRILITGASGGVGSFAVQLAKAFGAEVTAECSTPKVDFVRSLGADHVLDYAREDFVNGSRRFDAVLDLGGAPSLARLRRVLTPKGRLVIGGGEAGGRWLGGFDRQLRALLLSRFVGQTLTTFVCTENQDDLIVLARNIQSGRLTPVVDRTFELADAAQALRYLVDGRARGKIAVTI